MAYLDTIDERVIYRAHLHWIIFVRPILIIIIGAICLAACLAVSDNILWRWLFRGRASLRIRGFDKFFHYKN